MSAWLGASGGTESVTLKASKSSSDSSTSAEEVVASTTTLFFEGTFLTHVSSVWRTTFEKRGPIRTYSRMRSSSSSTTTLSGDRCASSKILAISAALDCSFIPRRLCSDVYRGETGGLWHVWGTWGCDIWATQWESETRRRKREKR